MHKHISIYEINKKIDDILFSLREAGIIRDGDTISNLSPEQYQHVIVKMASRIIYLIHTINRNDRVIIHRGQQLDDIKDAMKVIKNILKKNYEGE